MKEMFITIECYKSEQLYKTIPCCLSNDISWIDLTGNTKYEYVGNVIHTLCIYNNLLEQKNISTDELLKIIIDEMNHKEVIAPGGIHFVGENRTEIYPSCCCGLEDWREIKSELMIGHSPWMGHDPYVNYREQNEACIISTGSEPNENPFKTYERITYSKKEFLMLLSRLDRDFISFVRGPLTAYLQSLSTEYVDDFCNAFYYCFGGDLNT